MVRPYGVVNSFLPSAGPLHLKSGYVIKTNNSSSSMK